MCFAVLVVKYKNNLEPNATVPIAEEAELEARINEYTGRPTVECIEVHKLSKRIQRVEQWVTEEVSEPGGSR
jgi:hypothetical protein